MRPRLLLAEDELSIRESLRKLLQAEQYDVVLAGSGNEAVAKFRGDPTHFDLVLTDLNMPLKNGWTSIDQLLEINPLLPIILLTGIPNERALAETSHVRALVEKPIDVPGLLSFMRELLIDIRTGQSKGLPRRTQPFHYLPSHPSNQQQMDPYSRWGIE